MSKLARKLVLSVLTVVLTVIALGTTTFAWFTLTNTSVVQPFSANITSDTGIEIALGVPVPGDEDELNWVTTLTTAVINNYIESVYGSFQFGHVTTTNAVDFYTLGATSMTGTTGGYLSIPVNFRSNSANRILWSGVTLTAAELAWQSDVAFIGAKGATLIAGDSTLINASDSFRIAILGTVGGLDNVVGYESANSATNVVLGGGIANPQNLADGVGVGMGNQGAMNYYYAKNALLPFGAEAVTVLQTITALANNPIVDLSASTTSGAAFYGAVVIRVWLEGWDANAYNSVLGRQITTSFQFTGTSI
jgi:hypothetical protein